MSDGHGLCLQDFVSAANNNGTSNDHLHNHHNLHDSVSSAVSVSSAITGLMSSGNNSLNHLSHDTSNHHHHHHHSLSNTPALHEPLEKLKCKLSHKIIEIFFHWPEITFSHEVFPSSFLYPFHGYLVFYLRPQSHFCKRFFFSFFFVFAFDLSH